MLIVGGTILSGDNDRLLEGAALRIEGARIVAIGAAADLIARYPSDERLDADGMLVLPGLVNAHTHLHRLLTRGVSLETDAGGAIRTLRRLWARLGEVLGYEDMRYAALLGCAEALRNGVTTLFDQHVASSATPFALDAVAEAALQVGVRANLSYQVSDEHGVENARKAVQENARFAQRVRGDPLLSAAMGLDASRALSDGTLSAVAGAAALADIGLHISLSEDQTEMRANAERYGQPTLDHLRRFGLLGPRACVAHCSHLTDREVELLSQARGWAILTPSAALRLGGGRAPLGEWLKRGVNTCLGGDGFSHGLWGEMRTAYLLHSSEAPLARPPDRVAEIVLRGNPAMASRILRDRVGVLAEGALADLMLVDYASPTPLTAQNLGQHLALGRDGVRIDTVLVAGRVLLRRAKFTAIDEHAIAARARELAARLWSRL